VVDEQLLEISLELDPLRLVEPPAVLQRGLRGGGQVAVAAEDLRRVAAEHVEEEEVEDQDREQAQRGTAESPQDQHRHPEPLPQRPPGVAAGGDGHLRRDHLDQRCHDRLLALVGR
jgi:hypothetical protein